tara:strand:- start:5314 stop:6159 length:846 start_codon:yes stop_codon:yes gene_type:complete
MTFCFKKKLTAFLFFAILLPQDNHPYPPLDLVSIPTSGTLPRGSYTIEGLLTKNGGLVPKIMIGLNDNFSLGVSFGIQNFIGESKLEKNKDIPEFHLKYRVFEESASKPAFLVGIDTQGFGPYIENADYKTGAIDNEGNPVLETREINRYEQKAWGIYAVASKNWEAMGNLGFHIGLNRNTFERKDNDKSINYFFGLDKELNRSFSLLVEYNAALNDGVEHSASDPSLNGLTIGKGKGFLNAGLRWTIAQNLLIEVNFKDINLDDDDYVNREVKIMYSERF